MTSNRQSIFNMDLLIINFFLRLFMILTIFQLCLIDCLKIKSIYVPKAITIGESAWLNCSYELENDNLYSVTWFKANLHEINLKDKRQFYRYVHNDNPPTTTFETPGVYIDGTKSNRGSVYLYKSDLTTEGKYICEVIADSPSFQTATRTDDMRVHYLPEKGPTIEPAATTIHGNVDFINVTCKSGPSKPKARLTWYINEHPAPKQYVYDEDYLNSGSEDPTNGLKSSQVRLLFPVYQHSPNDNYYQLRCESQFVQSFSEIAQISISPSSQRSNDNNNNNFTAAFLNGLMRSSSGRPIESINANNDSIISKEGDLRIDGLKPYYQPSDRVNLTCRSGKSPVRSTPTKLTWLINNVEATRDMIQTYPIDSLGNSALGLTFTLNQSFFNKWSDPNELKRSKIIKCYALYEEILFQSSKDQVIRRITRESISESAAVNTADQVTMGSGSADFYGSRVRLVDEIIKCLLTLLIIL